MQWSWLNLIQRESGIFSVLDPLFKHITSHLHVQRLLWKSPWTRRPRLLKNKQCAFSPFVRCCRQLSRLCKRQHTSSCVAERRLYLRCNAKTLLWVCVCVCKPTDAARPLDANPRGGCKYTGNVCTMQINVSLANLPRCVWIWEGFKRTPCRGHKRNHYISL